VLWIFIGAGALIQPPDLYWIVITLVAWNFVAWSCMRIIYDWLDHKEEMRRIEYRYAARETQALRRHNKIMQQIERMKNARWN
jgi:hypothetical protein